MVGAWVLTVKFFEHFYIFWWGEKPINHKHIVRPKTKTSKAARDKEYISSRGTRAQMASDLSPETGKARYCGTH